MVFGPSKHRLSLLVFAGLGIVVGLGFWLVRPYLGFLPLLRKPPIDLGNVLPSTSTQPSLPTPGKNETGLPLDLPQGFSMGVFAKGLKNPRVIQFDPNGTVLTSIPSEGKIVALVDTDRNGVSDKTETVLEKLHQPHGFAFQIQSPSDVWKLYVAESNALSSFEYDPDKRHTTERSKLLTLPDDGRHWSKTLLALDPPNSGLMGTEPGELLIAMGSSCDVCHETDVLRASVQRYTTDGTLEPYAIGLRNAVFLTRRSDGQIWATEMGRDFLGDNLPPDEINILEKGKNYGWPNCYGKNIHDTVFDKNTYIRNPCMEPFETPSLIDLPAHSAPLGLAFVPSGKGWPKEYEGNLLVAYHGSWNRTVPTGYAIRRFVLDSKNNVVKDEDFVSGWLTEKGVLGRPADLKFASDGTLYVSDDRAGLVYRIAPPKQ
jgi:glucose/arabinose dehydrogenase